MTVLQESTNTHADAVSASGTSKSSAVAQQAGNTAVEPTGEGGPTPEQAANPAEDVDDAMDEDEDEDDEEEEEEEEEEVEDEEEYDSYDSEEEERMERNLIREWREDMDMMREILMEQDAKDCELVGSDEEPDIPGDPEYNERLRLKRDMKQDLAIWAGMCAHLQGKNKR
ncbi:hypothetical protein DFS34DRAFT_644708 [Phlyctochytrium arcticum]|nr:hypothetical protein DFS34DRAFT_644708 [Phlyctochytrium arcticum]